MKKTQIFIISSVLISSIFTVILALYEIPQTTMDWVLSEIILGVIIYINYLVIAVTLSSSKVNHFPFPSRKEAEQEQS